MNKKAIFAGICIGIAALANLLAPTPIVGAFLFCFGLITVLENKGELCTGMFGNCNTLGEWINVLAVWAENMFGALLITLLAAFFMPELTLVVYDASIVSVFIKSVLCGALIHLGVNGYKKGNKLLLILCVMIFVLCGFEHCIANIPLIVLGGEQTGTLLICFYVNIIGNAIGAKAINYFLN